MATIKVEGMPELEAYLKDMGKIPQRCATKAARQGATIAKKDSKRGRWIDQTGNLRKGIILKGERSRIKGKKVYQISIDPSMNDVFQKGTKSGYIKEWKNGKEVSRKGHYYYPASQEFGFRTKDGSYRPGFHFLRDGIVKNKSAIENKIVDIISKEIDKLK